MSVRVKEKVKCFHCDDETSNPITEHGHHFCCNGCKTVYEILNENDLCNYYDYSSNPGVKPDENTVYPFKHLDSPVAIEKLTVYEDEKVRVVRLHLPYMHCSSCVWLLEKLSKINSAISYSKVDFFRKEIKITYLKDEIKLSEVVGLLHRLGYAPNLSLASDSSKKSLNKNRILKLGIAGFCFGNIMLLNFPEYVDSSFKTVSPEISKWFSIIAVILSLPALIYSASEFFISAYKALRMKTLNIDLPISIAILATFIRSLYDILLGYGPGFLDTLCGIIFLMLLGRWFQDYTYKNIYFERNFKNYFPLFISKIKDGIKSSVQVEGLVSGDLVEIRHGEILPADAILRSETALFDMSFITGEAKTIQKKKDNYIYAGSKLEGSKAQFLIVKPVSRSYLTGIWENEKDQEKLEQESNYTEKIGKYFSLAILIISIIGFISWSLTGLAEAFNVFTAILIIACPCTILLAHAFTYGHAIRYLGRIGVFLKQNGVINKLASINHIAFDKTGTLTNRLLEEAHFVGNASEAELEMIGAVAAQSSHPVSISIANKLASSKTVQDFTAVSAKGIIGTIDNNHVCIGKASFLEIPIAQQNENAGAYVSINNQFKGYFLLEQKLRPGTTNMLKELKADKRLSLFSGDNDRAKNLFNNTIESLHFFLKPDDKLREIKNLQKQGDRVLMIGDGLNDAPALKAADCGFAVAETENCFFPSCDGLIKADQIYKLPKILRFVNKVDRVIFISFLASILYNIVGISFALANMLSPMVAAILMPACSITIIIVTWYLVHLMYKKMLKD